MLRSSIGLLAFVLTVSTVHAEDFSGQFVDYEATGATLTLQSQGEGDYAGTLSMDGVDVPVSAQVDGVVLEGQMDDGVEIIAFQARLAGTNLFMDLSFPDYPGEVMATMQFVRADSTAESPPSAEASEDIVVNGSVLTAEQAAQLQEMYGVTPLPGEYWYDAVSGLYGVVGYQAYGFMYPGHEFGTLDRNVSRGDTNVFVNGRELPQSEWLIWSYMLGYPIQMGAYWLDAQGNAGNVGNPMPTVNLFVAAQQNAYQGQGGSGDNFWSSRFGAGNSNADNTQGYVSVPGHGPIGYGF